MFLCHITFYKTDGAAFLGFLTSEETLTSTNKIEEVNAENLQKIVAEEKYVTVLFFDENKGKNVEYFFKY